MADQVGSAYIPVRPDMRGFHREIQRELGRSGQQGGDTFSDRFRERLQRAARSMPEMEVGADTSEADRELQALRRRLLALGDRRIGVDMDADEAMREMQALQRELERLQRTDPDIQVQADTAAALAQLAQVQAEINRLRTANPEIQADADTARAMALLAALQRQASSLDGERVNINASADTSSAVAGLMSLRSALSGLGLLAGPQLAAIGAGLIGLAGPLAAAGAGFGGLAAVAGPSIGRISAALKESEQAQKSAGAAAGAAQQQALAAAGARQQLAAAIRAAAQQHRQALEQVRSAEQQVEQAQRSARQAQEDLTRARSEARRALQDMKNDLAGARLAVQAQQIAVQESRAEWEGMARAAAAAAARVSAAQQQLTKAQADQKKVLADPAATDEARRQAQASVDAAKSAVQSAQAGQSAADLAAKKAAIHYQQSVQRMKEQQLQLKRLVADERAASKAGVDGSDQVRSARDRLAEASRRITESERALAAARANVARTDAQSADQVASARRAVTAAALSGASANNTLGQSLAKLSPLEREVMTAWEGLTGAFNEWQRSMQPHVLPLLTRGIGMLRSALPLLTPITIAAARAVGTLMDEFGAFTKSPVFTQFVSMMNDLVGPAILGFGRIAGNLVSSFMSIATAFAPIGMAFLGVIQQVTGAFAKFTAGLLASPAFQQFSAQMVQLLSTMGTQFASTFAQLAPILSVAMGALSPLLGALRQALFPILRAVVPVVALLVGALASIAVALAPVIPVIGQLITKLITGLTPILVPLAQTIGQVAGQIGLALVQALTQAAPALGQIVTALGQLLPQMLPLVPLIGQWVTTLLPLLPVVAQLAALLVTALMPVLLTLVGVFVRINTIAGGILISVLRILVQVITWVAGILQPIISGIGTAIRLLGVAAVWLWKNAIGPAFRGIATVAKWLWSLFAVVILGPFVLAFKLIGIAARALWTVAIRPVFNAIAVFFKSFVAPVWRWLFNGVVKPVMGSIGDRVKVVWERFIRPAFNALKLGLNTVADAFKGAVGMIGRNWDRLKDVARKPVKFVIDTVYNGGIVRMWNAVAKLVPGTKQLSPIKFAHGGVVGAGSYGVLPGYSPGNDTMLAAVSPGEAWIRPDATRALGPDFIYGLNSAAVSGGTAGAARFLSESGGMKFGLGGIVGGFLKSAKNMFTNGLVKTAKKAFTPLMNTAKNTIGGTPFGDLAVGTMGGLAGQILKFFKPMEGKIGGDGRKVVDTAGKYVGMSGNPNKWTRRMGMNGLPWCAMFVDGVFDESNASKALAPVTGGRAGVWSYRALPKVDPRHKKAGDLALYRGDAGHINMFTGKGSQTIGGNESNSVRRQSGYVNSASSIRRPRFGLGGIVPGLLRQDLAENDRRSTPLSTQMLRSVAGQPTLYDDGGWLPPGVTQVVNHTRKPEAVLTDRQLSALAGASRVGTRGGNTYVVNPQQHTLTEAGLSRMTARQDAIDRVGRPG